MSMKLRDLIRKVRACKTAAEERAVIAKESAMIRTAIREEQEHYRHRNVAKLLFMHMLGYPTHFGQLECMKLTASPHFPEKRIGYLGMMLLLSEEADVLMLTTNSLKNDLNSENKFVVGLALCAIGNLATADMSRDLAPEVDKHLKSNVYLRKKANLAMARCLRKCPDLVEDFVDRVVSLLKDKSHGVLITVVELMTEVLVIDYENAVEEGLDPFSTDCRRAFLRLVPMLVKMLRNLLSSGSSPEYDIAGIADPFLQVQLLTLLRLLGAKNEKASEEMNDVLAQVATNTDTSKNAGNAILYECVQTVMGIESEDGLRVLAVNILGRFLLNRDNNIRYVALNTLSRCIVEQKQLTQEGESSTAVAANASANSALSALQKHRNTVVDCLKDPDVTIRQRALELIYHLVNHENVRTLTAELLNYLVLCPREHRSDICTRILRVVDRFSPDDRWRVDQLITMMTIAGREASRDVQSATIVYISRAPADVHAYATHKLLKAVRDDDGGQRGLLAVGIWCIGEFGDMLLKQYSHAPTPGGENGNGTPVSFMEMDPSSIVDVVETVIKRHSCTEVIKQRALTCFAKLTDRFADKGDAAALSRLDGLIKKHQGSHSLELQLRSCEYDALLHAAKGMKLVIAKPSKPDDDIFGVAEPAGGEAVSAAVQAAAKEALARMPVVDVKMLQRRQAADAFAEGKKMPGIVAPSGTSSASDDLLDIFGGGGAEAAAPAAAAAATSNGPSGGADGGKSDLDILADVFAASSAAPAAAGGYDPFSNPAPTGNAAAPAAVNPLDLFGAPAQTAPASANTGVDLFGSAAATGSAPAPAPAAVNPLDLFGATPAAASTPVVPAQPLDMFGAAPAAAAPAASPLDMFGGGGAVAPAPAAPADPFASMAAPQPPQASKPAPATSSGSLNPLDLYGAPAPAAPVAAGGMDLFGGQPASTIATPPVQAQQSTMAAPQQAAPPSAASSLTVTGFTHSGLSIDFVCSKPDTWNKQNSELVATCNNSAGAPIYGFNLQCAVPKYVTMEMEPASSTTIAVTGGVNPKLVTQKIKVTNTQLGTKKLMLKLKVSFTLNGNKVEHMATCSGFPQGEY